MAIDGDIIPEMEVYGSDNVHVGTVDALQHARIMLNTVASSVPVEEGHAHFVLLDDVVRVEGNRIHLGLAGVDAVHPRPGAAGLAANRETINPGATLNRTGQAS